MSSSPNTVKKMKGLKKITISIGVAVTKKRRENYNTANPHTSLSVHRSMMVHNSRRNLWQTEPLNQTQIEINRCRDR